MIRADDQASADVRRVQLQLEALEERRRRYSGWRGFARKIGEIILAGIAGVLVGLALAWLAVTLAHALEATRAHADPLPPARALYVPPNYDEWGQPIEPCLATTDLVAGIDTTVAGDPTCYPRLWIHPDGVHNENLTGVRFAFYNPPPPLPGQFGSWLPLSHRVVWLQYWSLGHVDHAPAVGDTMYFERGGFVVASFHPSNWTDDPLVTTIESGWATFTSLADSVLEGKATVVVTAPGWSRAWTDTTYFRLVPETYRREVSP